MHATQRPWNRNLPLRRHMHSDSCAIPVQLVPQGHTPWCMLACTLRVCCGQPIMLPAEAASTVLVAQQPFSCLWFSTVASVRDMSTAIPRVTQRHPPRSSSREPCSCHACYSPGVSPSNRLIPTARQGKHNIFCKPRRCPPLRDLAYVRCLEAETTCLRPRSCATEALRCGRGASCQAFPAWAVGGL